MAAASKRAATRTTLVVGRVEIPVGLFTTVARPGKLAEFTTAGPHGGVLFYSDAAGEAPLSSDTPVPEIPVGKGNPLAVADPGSDAPPPGDGGTLDHAAHATAITPPVLTPGDFRQVLVEEGTNAQVAKADVRRGVRLDGGEFIDCTRHLELIEDETKLEQMVVVDFIDVASVERGRIEASYYIGADDMQALKPLRLIFLAMQRKRRVAIVRWSSRSRQSLGVLTAHGRSGCLLLLKLAWSEDWREPPAKALSVANARVSEEEVDIACRLVEAMSGKVASLDALRDEAIERREVLYEDALAGRVQAIEEPPKTVTDVEIEDAFAASLEELLASPRAGKG